MISSRESIGKKRIIKRLALSGALLGKGSPCVFKDVEMWCLRNPSAGKMAWV